jgi:uncharacterized protein (TIGR03083 family)
VRPAGEIDAVPLFAPLHERLMEVLGSLEPDEWARRTVAPLWTVKDVAAHLLDTQLRRLSIQRDGHVPPPPPRAIDSHETLVAFLNGLNAEWVSAMRRVSPRVLTDMLAATGPEMVRLYASLDPREPAMYPVGWAGEALSRNWFDLAREYTEWWHHQQQIRDAVGRPGIEGRDLFHPVLDTFLRALPFTYRAVEADEGAAVTVSISGEAGGDWTVLREDGAWRLYHGRPDAPAAVVSYDQDFAWRLLTKAWKRDDHDGRVRIDGDEALARPALTMVSVMA